MEQAYPDVSSTNALIPPASDGISGGTVNSPDLDPRTMKPKRRAISNVQHIFAIISTLEEARRDQNEKNGRILAKYNAERPFTREELEEHGLGWKSNFSTKPLSTAIDKVSPRLTKAVQSARYLTSASFPENHPGGKQKTELFRRKITDTIRGWDGWVDFLNEVSQENALFGFTTVAWLDEYSWRPTHVRQDEFFVTDGTKQNISGVQLWIGKQYLMIHELAAFIENKSAAEAAGWDIDNTVAAINAAAPRSITGGGNSNPYTDFRTFEDAIRESSVSLSLLSGSKTIEIYHLYVPECDGQVSHYIVDGRAKKILFEKLDQFEQMSDVLALFSFQQANGKLMGSKGIGRELFEIAAAIDRARNEVVDRLQLSGKILIQGEAKQPALRTVDDLTDLKAQQLVLFANEKRTDPLFDQAKLQKIAAAARIDAEFAEDVMLAEADPTVITEQSRQQELENLLLSAGREVPVSPRDNHQVHIEVLKPVIAAAAEQLGSGDPALMASFQIALGHWAQHIEVAVAAGAKKDEFAEDLRQIREAATQLGQLQATLAAQQEQDALMAQQGIPPEAIAEAQAAPAEQPPPNV